MTRVALLVIVAACWTQPKPPTEGSMFPGTTWISPPQPWRATQPPVAIRVENERTVLFGGAYGWIARMDLTTGKIVAEKHIPGDITFQDIVLLPRNRALVVGTRSEPDELGRATSGTRTSAIVLDLATFAATPVPLAAKSQKMYGSANAAAIPGGGIAISGPGLPLAIYNAESWETIKIVDEQEGWSGVRANEHSLVATRTSSVFAFDLKTNERRHIGIGLQAAASKDRIAMRRYQAGKWYIDTVDTSGNKKTLAAAVERFVLDPDDRWLVIGTRDGIQLHTLPDTKLWKKFDLGAAGRGQPLVEIRRDIVIVATSSTIHRIDLKQGVTSSPGAPPYGVPNELAVDNAGTVLAIGSEAWRMIDGAVVATAPLDGGTTLYMVPGETQRFGTMDDKNPKQPTVTVRSFVPGERTQRWRLDQDTLTGWLSSKGEVAIELLFDTDVPARLVRSDGARMTTVTEMNTDANVRDVDLDAGLVAIEMKGEVHIMRLAGKKLTPVQRLRAPRCEEYAQASLERNGPRALTLDGPDIIVWHATTGKVLGSIHVDDDVTDVMFVPNSEELLLLVSRGIALWSPTSGEYRTYNAMQIYDAAVSPDGKRLAFGLGDGRIALNDFAKIRAGMKVGRAKPLRVPSKCNDADPLDVGRDDDDDWHDGGDDPCGGDPCDPCGGDPCGP